VPIPPAALAAALALSLAASPSKPAPAPAKAKAAGPMAPAEATPGCVQQALALPSTIVITRAGTLRLTVAVGEDGTPGQVRVPEDVPPALTEALRAAVRGCRFTPARDAAGAPVAGALRLPVKLARSAEGAGVPAELLAPDDAEPVLEARAAPPEPEGKPPREQEEGCIGRALKLPPNRHLQGLLTFTVRVSVEGKAEQVVVPPEVERDVAAELERAVHWCPLVPATGPGGAARAEAMTVRLRFSQVGEAERQAQAGRLSREAAPTQQSCLTPPRGLGLTGHVTVSLTVSEAGVPSDMKLQPDNVPASKRLEIFDMLVRCRWDPALDLEGKPVASTTAVILRFR